MTLYKTLEFSKKVLKPDQDYHFSSLSADNFKSDCSWINETFHFLHLLSDLNKPHCYTFSEISREGHILSLSSESIYTAVQSIKTFHVPGWNDKMRNTRENNETDFWCLLYSLIWGTYKNALTSSSG